METSSCDPVTPDQAFAAIALAAVGCDGQLGRDEARLLRNQLEFRLPYRNCNELAMATLFDQLLSVLRTEGWSALVAQAVPVLLPDQRETALALAAHLVHADRSVTADERAFLTELSQRIELPGGRAETILEVIEVLHRDALA